VCLSSICASSMYSHKQLNKKKARLSAMEALDEINIENEDDEEEEMAESVAPEIVEEGRECVVCWSRVSVVALRPCGHVCLCQQCPLLSTCPM